MDRLKIEKSSGGIAPFGSAHLKSDAEVPLSELSAQDRAWVEALSKKPEANDPAGSNIPAYTLTLIAKDGKTRRVKVPEPEVPPGIRAHVKKDRLE